MRREANASIGATLSRHLHITRVNGRLFTVDRQRNFDVTPINFHIAEIVIMLFFAFGKTGSAQHQARRF